MSTVELTLSRNYVPSWGVVEAVRELFQNALDQEAVHPENVASWEYDAASESLRIRNKTSQLDWASLLLGATTKQEETKAIGQFGEGYKIAALVLLREGKGLTIYNYGAREVWKARFIKSRRFKTDILAFEIEKKAIWSRVPTDDLSVEVTGITEKEYKEAIIPSNLHLQTYIPEAEAPIGEILSASKYKGKVFVGGLFVCDFPQYTYGYNFKPGQLKLDRDRKLASDFDLKWLASKMWSSDPTLAARAVELASDGFADVAYLADMWSDTVIANEALRRFQQEFGLNAIPVTTQDELNKIPPGYKGIIVTDVYGRLIKKSPNYQQVDLVEDDPIKDLREWFEDISERYSLEQVDVERFEEIVKKLEK